MNEKQKVPSYDPAVEAAYNAARRYIVSLERQLENLERDHRELQQWLGYLLRQQPNRQVVIPVSEIFAMKDHEFALCSISNPLNGEMTVWVQHVAEDAKPGQHR